MMADHAKVQRLLKTARGQLDGILKMVEEDRYCIDISTQVMATEALLKRVNQEILAAHLEHCVKHAASEADRQQKIDEFVDTLGRILR
ncbi:metal-sensing transcriptional repressor [Pseudoflavonifractor sp. DSM 107456]|uniref:Copper-sensing transcriptional repressor CsoR n=2 Tax=Pseudoflavonifractor TaxID=1017280 RepID=A0ABR9RB69_9FIRM|nr:MULTISPECIES: metal-sensing transcriptional repressor [Eubacteriales]MBC5730409.1 metal-sensing transcriptional repressor [Pseudoflavonifractor hominis]MBE5055630.1 metal-sensing transcriptional repressor [Pseudoflavonifractor gallinarum]MBS5136040.1 metal-sensing transcriptional repressor [Oscillospiraceae bacterium]MBT9684050.1 metal-sensing transcriptional repressor [Pseudoflavonifractor sp. MCC625]